MVQGSISGKACRTCRSGFIVEKEKNEGRKEAHILMYKTDPVQSPTLAAGSDFSIHSTHIMQGRSLPDSVRGSVPR